MITITANIPEKNVKSKTGKVFSYPAHTKTYICDDTGCWRRAEYNEPCLEADVIDACRKADNWAEIKAANFPMVGFHA